ncbi:Uncharacterized protein APZ42_009279, partial [Daphnia magna]
IARPLTSLTKKDIPFIWGTDQVSSFNALKAALTSAPVLAHPNYELPMEILPDACGFGIGGVLAQRIDGVERPVAYASRLLSKSETDYSITEKECLALVWCLTKFRCFVWGCQVKVITDHQALCWLMSKRDLAGRLARWSLSLQEYDITIVYRSGKTHDNADCLSRNPLQQIEEMEDDRCFIVAAIGPNAVDILSPEENGSFIRKQRAHRDWSEKISKLEDGKERVKNFVLCNGKLYKETFKDGKNYRRLCVPVECRERILQAYHDDIVSGHLGIKRTLHKICSRFFWPKMNLDITRYVQSCVSCQGRKGVPDKPPGFLQCIKVERPFEKLGMDLLGPFPLSHKG